MLVLVLCFARVLCCIPETRGFVRGKIVNIENISVIEITVTFRNLTKLFETLSSSSVSPLSSWERLTMMHHYFLAYASPFHTSTILNFSKSACMRSCHLFFVRSGVF